MLALAQPAAAAADHDDPPVRAPAGAPAVAGPTAAGVELVAFDRGGRLCLGLRSARQARPFAVCERPPRRVREPYVQTMSTGDRRPRAFHLGVVTAEVASVDLLLRRGRTATAATSAGEAYGGRAAGAVRFFLVEAADARGFDELRYLRQRAPDGSVLALTDEGFSGPTPVAGTRVPLVARGRLRVTAFEHRALAALPDEPERFVSTPCIRVAVAGPDGSRTSGTSCSHTDGRELALNADGDCSQTVVTAIASDDVRRLRVVLGDGRARPLRLRRLRGAISHRRAGAFRAPAHVAVRAVVAERAGRRPRTIRLAVAPAGVACVEGGGRGYGLFGSPAARPTAVPEGSRLVAEERGALLCSAIGEIRSSEADCHAPPLDPHDVDVLTGHSETSTIVGAAVPGDVALADVVLHDGSRHRVEATVDGGGYAGRWRGRLRFVELVVPGRRSVEQVLLRDAAGRLLGRAYAYSTPPARSAARTVLRDRSGLRLLVARQARRPGERARPCVLLGTPRVDPRDFCDAFPALHLNATCRPRRLVLFGLLPAATRDVAVRTDRGLVRGRVRRVHGGRALLLVVPARDAARALVVTPRRGRVREHPLGAPPATRQCGWAAFALTVGLGAL